MAAAMAGRLPSSGTPRDDPIAPEEASRVVGGGLRDHARLVPLAGLPLQAAPDRDVPDRTRLPSHLDGGLLVPGVCPTRDATHRSSGSAAHLPSGAAPDVPLGPVAGPVRQSPAALVLGQAHLGPDSPHLRQARLELDPPHRRRAPLAL